MNISDFTNKTAPFPARVSISLVEILKTGEVEILTAEVEILTAEVEILPAEVEILTAEVEIHNQAKKKKKEETGVHIYQPQGVA